MQRKPSSWDTPSKLAALLCIIAALVPVATGAVSGGSSEGEWLLLPLAIILFVPFVGAPQLAMLILIRWTDLRLLKLAFLAASFVMIGALGWFVATADLTSTSTAPLAMLFFPLYLGGVSFVAGALLLWVVKAARRRR